VSSYDVTTKAAFEAIKRGYAPLPIPLGGKRPARADWKSTVYDDSTEKGRHEISQDFTGHSIGLILGETSGGLVDVDVDHPSAGRLVAHFLPPTRMRSGRPGNPDSHHWYRVTGNLPGYRKFALPSGETLIELRSTGGHQTLIPPSTHPSGETYEWSNEPWGGVEGPAAIDGKRIAARVATLALAATLLENWPVKGGRHDAYLALAGGLLRLGESSVHPYWRESVDGLIFALASANHDRDGAAARVMESVPSTITRIKNDQSTAGWPTLAEHIGEESVRRAKSYVAQIESIVDWKTHLALESTGSPLIEDGRDFSVMFDFRDQAEKDAESEATAVAQVSLEDIEFVMEGEKPLPPLERRVDTWAPVDLAPYLAGEIVVPDPTILRRSDGKGLFYQGRVNMLFGRSEGAKSWIATYACLQEIAGGDQVLYIDLEDDPTMMVKRMNLLGGDQVSIQAQLQYIRPETPLSPMQRDSWGNVKMTDNGKRSLEIFEQLVNKHDPGLIVIDGMSVLYGLHGLSTNDVKDTDVITNWLKSLTRKGRSTPVVIDHTGKGSERGSMPIGSQHKISMVQGCAIQAHPINQPMPGALGKVELIIAKDRPGAVREFASKGSVQVAAEMHLDSTNGYKSVMEVLPPAGSASLDPVTGEMQIEVTEKMQKRVERAQEQADKDALPLRIEQTMANYPDRAFRISEIQEILMAEGFPALSEKVLRTALRRMEVSSTIKREGAGGSTRYRLP